MNADSSINRNRVFAEKANGDDAEKANGDDAEKANPIA